MVGFLLFGSLPIKSPVNFTRDIQILFTKGRVLGHVYVVLPWSSSRLTSGFITFASGTLIVLFVFESVTEVSETYHRVRSLTECELVLIRLCLCCRTESVIINIHFGLY